MRRNAESIFLRFGTFDLTKDDLVALEKLILRNIKKTEIHDHWVTLGKDLKFFGREFLSCHEYASARFIPDKPRIYHYAELRVTGPNILIRFTARATEVNVYRAAYKGERLQQMSLISRELEKYFQERTIPRTRLSRLHHYNTIRIAC